MSEFESTQRAIESISNNALAIYRKFQHGQFISVRDLRDILWKVARIDSATRRLLGEDIE